MSKTTILAKTWRWATLLGVLSLLGWALLDRGATPKASWQFIVGMVDLVADRWVFRELFLNPWFYGIFAGVLILEWLIPARASQRSLSRGLEADLFWVLLKTTAHVTLLPFYLALLQGLYSRHLDFLTFDAVEAWPSSAKVLFALLFGDLVFWITHFVRHKVHLFWKFHAVHHSQRELNFFSEYRVHPVDDVFVYTIGFIPLFMFEMSGATVVAIVWIRHWHTRLYHANIRTDFGPLRYLLVTPQSHRIHHSSEPEHQDKNFGLTFSIWDQLFGTQYRGWEEYPETGIEDEDFPLEQGRGFVGALLVTFRQLIYPFQSIRRSELV